jgi:AcrR family transcriptional regulator
MANPGVVEKGRARREEILAVALEEFAASGYRGTSLRRVAERTGVTQAGLLYHFGSRENLLVEVLRRREQLGRESNPEIVGTPEAMGQALRRNVATPGLVELHSVLATQAADPQHPAHEYFTERYAQMRERFASELARRAERGELTEGVDPERLATILIALADGLQVQWMLDPRIDMADHLDHLLDLLRAGRA